MSTTPTNNAIPSESPKNLAFNAGKIDEFVNSPEDAFSDRFGIARLTLTGIQAEADNVILALGFVPVDSFEAGATISSRNQALHYLADNNYYRWDGSLSSAKFVPASSTPTSAGGVAAGAWVNVTDNTLRGQLARSSAGNGAALIKSKKDHAGTIERTQQSINNDVLTVKDFGAVGDGIADDTVAIQAALDACRNLSFSLYFPSGVYLITNTVVLYTGTVILGSGRGTTIKLKSGSGVDMIRSYNATALWGVTSQTTLDGMEQVYDVYIHNITLDGGVTDWSSSPTGDGIAIWGSRLDLENIGIKNIGGRGIRTEFTNNGVPYQKPWIESTFRNIRVERCGMECWSFKGPGDSKISEISLLDGSRYGNSIYNGLDIKRSGATFSNVHVSHDYNDPRGYIRHRSAVYVSAPSSFVNGCQFEGADFANVVIDNTSDVNFSPDTNIYSAYSDTNIRLLGNIQTLYLSGVIKAPMSTSSGSSGIVFSDSTILTKSVIDMVMWNQENTAISIGNNYLNVDGGSNVIKVTSYSSNGGDVNGSFNTAAGTTVNIMSYHGGTIFSSLDSINQKKTYSVPANSTTTITYKYPLPRDAMVFVQPYDLSANLTSMVYVSNASKTSAIIRNPNSTSINVYVNVTY